MRLITISRNAVIVADGDMGQDFAPLNTTIALKRLIGDHCDYTHTIQS
jgi:hypothetical protein